MKTDNILIFGSFFLVIIIILGNRPAIKSSNYVNRAIGEVNQKFQKDLQAFVSTTIRFSIAAQKFQNSKESVKQLENDYSQLRASFKTVEFFIEYLDQQAFDKMLNGAPLPKLEQKVADLTILNPKGLQVIDELMASEWNYEDKQELVIMTSKLQKDARKMQRYFQSRSVTDRQFFEACRQAVIRLATLGITGFDTPGTQAGIEDTAVVLANLEDYFKFYEDELQQVKKRGYLKDLNQILALGLRRAETKSFQDFNRLLFIKEVINPLYKTIHEIHLGLDYETIDEVSRYPLAVNYKATNLFEKEFLNQFYYVSLQEDEHFEDIASLGKLLFYDPVMSKNNEMSCASCHLPEMAFTDGLTTSLSNSRMPVKRNAMTLNYAGYASGFFHDLRTKRLEDQFEHVVLNKDEFNSSYAEILEKLQSSDTYVNLFKGAFPNQKKAIKSNSVDYALAAYVMKLSSFDNPVDQYFQGLLPDLPAEVERGFNLFTGKANCATCHFTPLYSGLVPPLYKESEAEVLGVPDQKELPWTLDDDLGRLDNGVTKEVAYFFQGAFKTPTIRNIDKTAPYMHNGVFDTLEEVMDFYNEGGGAGRGLELEHQTLAADPLHLSETEISDIIAFMKHLNDVTTFKPSTSFPIDFKSVQLNTRNRIK